MFKGYKRFFAVLVTIIVSFNLVVSPIFIDIAYGNTTDKLTKSKLVPRFITDGRQNDAIVNLKYVDPAQEEPTQDITVTPGDDLASMIESSILGKDGLTAKSLSVRQLAGQRSEELPLGNKVDIASLLLSVQAAIAASNYIGTGKTHKKAADGCAVANLQENLQLIATVLDMAVIIGGSEGKTRDNAPSLTVKEVINAEAAANGILVIWADAIEGTTPLAEAKKGSYAVTGIAELPIEVVAQILNSPLLMSDGVLELGKLMDLSGKELASLGIPFCHDQYIIANTFNAPDNLIEDHRSTRSKYGPTGSPRELLQKLADSYGMSLEDFCADAYVIGLGRTRHAPLHKDLAKMKKQGYDIEFVLSPEKDGRFNDGDLPIRVLAGYGQQHKGRKFGIVMGGSGANEAFLSAMTVGGRAVLINGKLTYPQQIGFHASKSLIGSSKSMVNWRLKKEDSELQGLGIIDPAQPVKSDQFAEFANRAFAMSLITEGRGDLIDVLTGLDGVEVTEDGIKINSVVADTLGRLFLVEVILDGELEAMTENVIARNVGGSEEGLLASMGLAKINSPLARANRLSETRALLAEADHITATKYAEKFGVDTDTATRELDLLAKRHETIRRDIRFKDIQYFYVPQEHIPSRTGIELIEIARAQDAIVQAVNPRVLMVDAFIDGVKDTDSIILLELALSEAGTNDEPGYASSPEEMVSATLRAMKKHGVKGDRIGFHLDHGSIGYSPKKSGTRAEQIAKAEAKCKQAIIDWADQGATSFAIDASSAAYQEEEEDALGYVVTERGVARELFSQELSELEEEKDIIAVQVEATKRKQVPNVNISAKMLAFMYDVMKARGKNYTAEVETGHIGEIDPETEGPRVTTPAEATTYLSMLFEAIMELAVTEGWSMEKLAKVSEPTRLLAVQTGSIHGHAYDKDGQRIEQLVDEEANRRSIEQCEATKEAVDEYCADNDRPTMELVMHGTTGIPYEGIRERRHIYGKANVATVYMVTLFDALLESTHPVGKDLAERIFLAVMGKPLSERELSDTKLFDNWAKGKSLGPKTDLSLLDGLKPLQYFNKIYPTLPADLQAELSKPVKEVFMQYAEALGAVNLVTVIDSTGGAQVMGTGNAARGLKSLMNLFPNTYFTVNAWQEQDPDFSISTKRRELAVLVEEGFVEARDGKIGGSIAYDLTEKAKELTMPQVDTEMALFDALIRTAYSQDVEDIDAEAIQASLSNIFLRDVELVQIEHRDWFILNIFDFENLDENDRPTRKQVALGVGISAYDADSRKLTNVVSEASDIDNLKKHGSYPTAGYKAFAERILGGLTSAGKDLSIDEVKSLLDVSRVIHTSQLSIQDGAEVVILDPRVLVDTKTNTLIEGADVILAKLRENNIKLFVLTEEDKDETLAALREAGITEEHIENHYVIGNVSQEQTGSAILEITAKEAAEINQSVYIGVNVDDIIQAKKAGVIAVAFLQEMGLLESVLKSGVDYLVNVVQGPVNWEAADLIRLGI